MFNPAGEDGQGRGRDTGDMTNQRMRALLEASPVRLAPMASFTNVPFRRVAIGCGSGFTTNEEIDADGLIRESETSLALMQMDPALGAVAMQLLGNSAETLVPAAVRLVEAGADIIDINMGCPVRKVVTKGKGAAMMRDVAETARVLSALRRALDGVPLTIKIRGGWDDQHCNAVEVAQMAEEVGVDAITVHPRTRAQRFGGRAPWDLIGDVVEAVSIPVTGNGDVTSLTEARRMMSETGCASVMIGRAALGRPWIFDAAYDALDADGRAAYEQRVVDEHICLIDECFEGREALTQMKKHLAKYIGERPGTRRLRAEMFAQTSEAALREVFARQFEVVEIVTA